MAVVCPAGKSRKKRKNKSYDVTTTRLRTGGRYEGSGLDQMLTTAGSPAETLNYRIYPAQQDERRLMKTQQQQNNLVAQDLLEVLSDD